MHSVIDMDDVLIDLHQAFIIYAKNHLGIEMDIQEHIEFSFYRRYGISDSDFLDIIQKPDLESEILPHANSARALHKLKSLEVTRNIVTARGYMKNPVSGTEKILEACNLPYDKLYVVPEGKRKSDIYKSFENKIIFMADDAVHNIHDAIQSKVVENIYLINRNWNKSFQQNPAVTRSNCILEATLAFEKVIERTQHISYGF